MKILTILLVCLAIAVLAVLPLLGIWALNTLFELTIAYSFKTWLAASVLAGVVAGTGRASNSK